MTTRTRRSAFALLFCLLAPLALHAQTTLVTKKRLGNNTEGVTYAATGPYKDRALAIDGNDVISIALQGTGHTTLFNVLNLDIAARTPRGIGYVPTSNLFYFAGKFSTPQIFVSDASGNPQATLNVAVDDAADWSNFEGLAYIPATAPAFGGALAALGARRTDYQSHVFYLDPSSGAVLGEVTPQAGTPLQTYLCGIHYWPAHPGTLLVTDCNTSGVWQMDMQTGAIIGDGVTPLIPSGGVDLESVLVRNNGDIYVSDYEAGTLTGFTPAVVRDEGLDRDFVIGLGVSAGSLAYNYDTGEILTRSRADGHLFALPTTLKTARRLPDINSSGEETNVVGIAYLGNGKAAYSDQSYPRGVDIVDLATGASLSRLTFLCCQSDPDPFPPGAPFQPFAVAMNGTSTFLLRVGGDANNFKVVTRSGTLDTSVYPNGVIPTRLADVALSNPATGDGLTIFDQGQGPRIFTGTQIYDFDGNLLSIVDQSVLGIADSLESGAYIGSGKFAVEDGDTSTIVIFKQQ